ncbi:hypothetical protein K2173_004029 [Erythroxylum novogranatense]|uniref:Sphingomyelin synthase-like domain-containing protein n=1 Tax=Erythroxylum novogranatense TaxID=1862640 RepID=A0AAV8SK06_9ROSI|nr:hypothetical protein K2173_004029 [Erythroxylum novogranatense]
MSGHRLHLLQVGEFSYEFGASSDIAPLVTSSNLNIDTLILKKPLLDTLFGDHVTIISEDSTDGAGNPKGVFLQSIDIKVRPFKTLARRVSNSSSSTTYQSNDFMATSLKPRENDDTKEITQVFDNTSTFSFYLSQRLRGFSPKPFCFPLYFIHQLLTYGLQLLPNMSKISKASTFISESPHSLWFSLCRKFCSEFSIEISLVAENWKLLLAGIAFQYIHGLAAHGIHYLHRPGPLLRDTGFFLLPELGQDKAYVSETLFAFIFCSFALWTFHPFIFQNKRFIHSHLVLGSCLVSGANVSFRAQDVLNCPLQTAVELLIINFSKGVNYGCGDLIFSSHMIFTLVFVRTFHKHGTRRCIKQFAWLLAILQSLLILASRKHYSVDVVVAW